MEMPSLEGQPPWVVILVAVLVMLGGLGVAWIKRGARDDDPPEKPPRLDAEPATVSLPPGPVFDPVHAVVDSLTAQAVRSAEDADRAEAEAKSLARQLADCERQQAVLQERHDNLAAQLAACRQMHPHRQENGR